MSVVTVFEDVRRLAEAVRGTGREDEADRLEAEAERILTAEGKPN